MEKQTKAIVLLSTILILTPFFINNSYGVTAPTSDPSLPEISLQLELYNSKGELVLYIEPTIIYLGSTVPDLHKFLDTVPNKTISVKDGIKYETVHFKDLIYFTRYSGQTSSYLYYNGNPVLTIRYDGFITQPGEVLHQDWKLVRIVH